ncbi:MAG: OadG-related small transporter subunit [Candidatus Brocadiia bacterium]
MRELEFGLSMALVGMSATLLTLCLLGVLAWLLKKIFPYNPCQGQDN